MNEAQEDEVGRPEPGSLNDLLNDARQLGLDFDERPARDWHRRGLLGSPQRRPLGRSRGSGAAVYSSEQRALFQAVVRNRVTGCRYSTLATVPVWAWLNYGDDWVSLAQLRRALRSAVGPHPGQSLRLARQSTQQLLQMMDFGQGRPGDRGRLRDELTEQLYDGRINPNALRPLVAAVFQPVGLPVVRGPAAASLTVDTVTFQLAMRLRAAAKLHRVTDEQLHTARLQHQASWAEYQQLRPELAQHAGSLRPLFDEAPLDQQVLSSVGTLLLLLGIQLTNDARTAGT